jgi:hypothetical protein
VFVFDEGRLLNNSNQDKEAMEAVKKVYEKVANVLSDTLVPPVHIRALKRLIEDAGKKLDLWQARCALERKKLEMQAHGSMLHAKQLKDFYTLITG